MNVTLIFLAFVIRNWSRELVVRCLSRNVPEIMDPYISMLFKEKLRIKFNSKFYPRFRPTICYAIN